MTNQQLVNNIPNLHHSYIPLNGDAIHKLTAEVSVLYAHKNGYKIILHTNTLGAKEFSHIPYDDVLLDLNNIKSNPKGFFAFSKMLALENIPLGDVHIDCDVWLKKACITKYDSDVIVQSLETYNDGIFRTPVWESSSKSFSKCEYPQWAERECKFMYNCGVVGFNNQDVKKEYIDTYWKMIQEFSQKGEKVQYSVPDIIIEQQFLYDLCKYYKLDVTLVLPMASMICADKIGYQHLIGNSKRCEIEKIKKVLNFLKKG